MTHNLPAICPQQYTIFHLQHTHIPAESTDPEHTHIPPQPLRWIILSDFNNLPRQRGTSHHRHRPPPPLHPQEKREVARLSPEFISARWPHYPPPPPEKRTRHVSPSVPLFSLSSSSAARIRTSSCHLCAWEGGGGKARFQQQHPRKTKQIGAQALRSTFLRRVILLDAVLRGRVDLEALGDRRSCLEPLPPSRDIFVGRQFQYVRCLVEDVQTSVVCAHGHFSILINRGKSLCAAGS